MPLACVKLVVTDLLACQEKLIRNRNERREELREGGREGGRRGTSAWLCTGTFFQCSARPFTALP